MLPGEEFAVERWYSKLKAKLLDTRESTTWSYLPGPSNDGSTWWTDPQTWSAIMLALMAVLLSIHIYANTNLITRCRSAPRSVVHSLRRIRERRRRHVLRAPRQPLFDIRRVGRSSQRGLKAIALGFGGDDGGARARERQSFANARSVLESRLSTMVGLQSIKEHLYTLLDTLEMDQRRCAAMPEFVSQRSSMHMVFLGNPGTGKTAVAQLIAGVLNELGVLRRGHLVVAKKDDLLGRYSNHVARNTRAVVESALGGVLVIDEAYSLLQGEIELGREAINVLVDMCYAHRDDLVVVLAGYDRAMAELFDANAGLASRFPHKFAFPDYTPSELGEIAEIKLRASRFRLADKHAASALARLVAPIATEVPCGNARSVENRIAGAISVQSTRLRHAAAAAAATAAAAAVAPSATPPIAGRGRADSLDEMSLFEMRADDFDEAARLAEKAAGVLQQQEQPDSPLRRTKAEVDRSVCGE